MSQTSTNLSLTLWTSLSDPYDSSELVDNFVKIDLHNHATAGGAKIPFAGIHSSAIATSGTVSSTQLVRADDLRLSDGRPPDFKDAVWSTDDDYIVTATLSTIVRQTATLTSSRTVTLPAANALPAGSEIIIQAGSSVNSTNTININRAGTTDTINGGNATVVIGAPYGFRRFITDGNSAWVYDAGVLRASNNLSDVVSASTARTNLGLGGLATLNTVSTSEITNGTILDADINASAAIASSKLAISGVTAGSYDKVTVSDRGIVTAGANIGYGSTLPLSPSAGDEHYLIVDQTNLPGVVWHLRYKDSTNKWEYLGGSTALNYISTSATLATGTLGTNYVYNLSTGNSGPVLAVPVAGVYRIEFGYTASHSGNNENSHMGIFNTSQAGGGTTPGITNAEVGVYNVSSGQILTGSKIIKTTLSVGTLYAQFRASGNTATFIDRWISICPVNIGA